MSDEMTQRLKSRLGRKQAERRSLVDAAKRERRSTDQLTADEDQEFRDLTSQINELEERLDELQEEDQRASASNQAMARAGLNGRQAETSVYGRESRNSYFADLARVSLGMADYATRERLNTYGQEQRDLNRADGSGGYLVPPSWKMDELIELARPGRVTADLLTRRPLPPGTDTINIPKIVTGTSVAMQPGDNDPVAEVDLTDSFLTASVRTIAGQQDIALQLLDQSPLNFDEIVLRDLLGAHAQQMGAQVLSGTGTAGQLLGLRNVSGIESVTWTSATPTAAELQRRVADCVQRIASALYTGPNAIIMSSRRWAWLLTQNDTSNRPLVLPDAYSPSNAQGLVTGVSEGRVGSSPACRSTSTTASRRTSTRTRT